MQAAEFIRSQASRLWALNTKEQEQVLLPQPPSLPPRAQRQLPPEPLGDMSNDHEGIDQPTLFAHLMKLSQDEAAAAVAAPVRTARKKEAPPRMLSVKASTPSDDLATFKRDSADVRRWMKHALEDLHIDTIVVASAAALASQYLRRRYRLRSTHRGSGGGGGGGGGSGGGGGNSVPQRGAKRKSAVASLRASSAAPADPVAAGELQRGGSRSWLGRRLGGGSGKGDVKAVLLSVTCIHLATKYHNGCDEMAAFGAGVKLHSVIKLGLDLSLSMGTFLNASFRANPVALQGLFCDMAGESAVVRACSEWFALCLVLLLHPSDEDDERLTTRRGQRTPSPATSIDTGSTSTCSTSPASSDLDEKDATNSPRTPLCPNAKNPSVAEQRGVSAHHRRFSRATSLALGALVLARRLARSEGPCLPLRVRALIRVDNDESLQLVREGIDAARSAFRTIVVDANVDSAGEGGSEDSGGGRDILAGDIVFGQIIADVPPPGDRRVVNPGGGSRRVLSARAERRTLLEWVSSTCKGDTQAYGDTRIEAGQEVCPDEALACDEELPCLEQAPIVNGGDKAADGGHIDFVRGVPLSVKKAVGSARAPLSPGRASSSGCPSPGSNNDDGAVVHARGYDDSADSLGYSESARSSSNGNEAEEVAEEEKEEKEGVGEEEEMGEGEEDDGGEESEAQSKHSMASCGSTDEEVVPSAKLPRKRGTSSDMDHADLSESPDHSPSPMDVSSMQASHRRGSLTDKVGSPYFTPGLGFTPPPPFFRRDAMDIVGDVETSASPRRPLSATDSVPGGGSDTELTAHLAKKVAATRRSSRKRSLPSEEEAVNASRQRQDQRPSKRRKTTTRRERSSQGGLVFLLRSASSKQQERETRWGIMKDRVITSLEYRCGCSFCKLCDGGGATTSGVEEGGKERRQARTLATP